MYTYIIIIEHVPYYTRYSTPHAGSGSPDQIIGAVKLVRSTLLLCIHMLVILLTPCSISCWRTTKLQKSTVNHSVGDSNEPHGLVKRLHSSNQVVALRNILMLSSLFTRMLILPTYSACLNSIHAICKIICFWGIITGVVSSISLQTDITSTEGTKTATLRHRNTLFYSIGLFPFLTPANSFFYFFLVLRASLYIINCLLHFVWHVLCLVSVSPRRSLLISRSRDAGKTCFVAFMVCPERVVRGDRRTQDLIFPVMDFQKVAAEIRLLAFFFNCHFHG